MTLRPKFHPIDFSELEKGSYLSPKECEEALGEKRGSKKYQLGLMNLSSEIYRYFQTHFAEVVTTCVHKDGVKVLTDVEASEYNIRGREKALRSLGQSCFRMSAVDLSNLTEDQKKTHLFELSQTAHYMSAVNKARKELSFKEQASKPLPKEKS